MRRYGAELEIDGVGESDSLVGTIHILIFDFLPRLAAYSIGLSCNAGQ